mmetsp:Transcript_20142/g.47630  ORF Transcript_20142/g.47630 Transcript_20142/m.47630 type:complete len:231 (-) Transcript_20142:675-1367(-)
MVRAGHELHQGDVHAERHAGRMQTRFRAAAFAFCIACVLFTRTVHNCENKAKKGQIPEQILLLNFDEEKRRIVPQCHKEQSCKNGSCDELHAAQRRFQYRRGRPSSVDVGLRSSMASTHPGFNLVRQLVVLPEGPLRIVRPLPPERRGSLRPEFLCMSHKEVDGHKDEDGRHQKHVEHAQEAQTSGKHLWSLQEVCLQAAPVRLPKPEEPQPQIVERGLGVHQPPRDPGR